MAPPRRLLLAVLATVSVGASLAAGADALASSRPVVEAGTTAASAIPQNDHLDPVRSTPAPTASAMASAAPTQAVLAAASAPARVATPPRRAVSVPPPPPAAPPVMRDHLTSGDGSLSTGVGIYSDCTGTTPLTRVEAAIDSCITGPTYFVGHNVGVFTPLMHMGVGSIITYYDGNGAAHVWRVASVRGDWRSAGGVPAATEADVVAQFQTCVVADGSVDRILDVVDA